MYITQLDELFDNIINSFYNFLNDKKAFDVFKKDLNFVSIQNYIIDLIKEFTTKKIKEDDILKIIKNRNNYNFVFEIIKRYCAYYVYLSIAYLYEGGRDLYATNIIESSKNQKNSTYQIDNFFNSENNAQLISFFNDIKNLLSVIKLGKTMEQVKIILRNNPINFESTLKFIENVGDDYIIKYVLIKNNAHNILKTIIFRFIYLNEEKKEILRILKEEEEDKGEYKYIEVVYSKESKLIDFTLIQKFLDIKQIKDGLAEEIYNYLEENREEKELSFKKDIDYVQYLFSNKVLIPITEEFLRFHKDSEKYDSDTLVNNESNLKERDATKIKYIINKMNKLRNFKSDIYENNPKLKLDVAKLFYKPLDYKEAALYNDNEEIKIIQKLEESEKTADLDLLGDLENLRKYAYVNYKDYTGLKIRPSKPTICLRKTNMKFINSRNKNLETRIGNDNLDVNVVGVALNPSKIPLDCFKKDNIIDVNKLLKTDNGFIAFKKIVESTFNTDKKVLFYWLFNEDNDIPDLKEYVNFSKLNKESNILTLLSDIYKSYSKSVEKDLINNIKKYKELNNYQISNILKEYNNKYLNFDFNPVVKNTALSYALTKKLIEKKVIPDEIDSIIPGKGGQIIKLPELDIKKYQKNIIIISDKKEEIINLDNEEITPICEHYIKWRELRRMRKDDNYSQGMFNFIKQYVRLNEKNDYTCKSCGEYLNIPNNIVTGTFVKEKDEFLTTNIIVNVDLERIPKYSKFRKTIRNIQKNIEKFAYSTNLTFYIGSLDTKKMRRKMVIKDTVDLLLLNNQYLKSQPKDRISTYAKKYGINESYTRLFFFELKDDIFVSSSDDTDKFKPIKFNNILTYMLLIIISDLNPGQIIGLKYDKTGNYYRFNLLKDQIFGKLYLRMNEKEKMPALSRPLFCYVVYYLSSIYVSNFYWMPDTISKEKKKGFDYNMHIIIIHTLFDLLNSIFEANIDYENKNFMYQILSIRMYDKLNNLYNDIELLTRIENESKNDFKIEGNKLKYVVKKIDFVNINDIDDEVELSTESCTSATATIETKRKKNYDNDLNLTTNCPDGRYHNWSLSDNDLICSLCNQKLSSLNKKVTSTVEDYQHIINQLKHNNFKKLLQEYCLNGDFHDFAGEDKEVCSKCKINPFTYKYTDKQISIFEKSMQNNDNSRIMSDINKTKDLIKNTEKEKLKSIKILKKFEKRYKVNTKFKIINYIDDFIDRLIKIIGKKPKITEEDIYIKDTYYLIDHDYLGIESKNGFKIFDNENKVIHEVNNKYVNRDVYYYKDRTKNISVYYDAVNLQYLGYFENNKFYKQKSISSIKIKYSIRDKLRKLGISNMYVRKDILTTSDKNSVIVGNLIKERVNNLKHILSNTLSIIYSIKNRKKGNSFYSLKEKVIINTYIRSIKKFNVLNKDKRKAIFKHSKYIINKSSIGEIPDNLKIQFNSDYINTNILESFNNIDSKFLFFLIYNFNRLLEYNIDSKNNQITLSSLIVRLIEYYFDEYYIKYEDIRIRRFIEEESIKAPFLNDSYRIVKSYEELLDTNGIGENIPSDMNTEELQEMMYDMQEEFDALDIDDMDENDDAYMPESEYD